MGGDPTQSPEAVRAQLKRVLSSRFFRTSDLPKKFLTFVVLRALERKTREIKEYSIGVEGFGRGADFDPRIDSVVRVVARRVRDRLAEYYRHDGNGDRLLIEVPTGSYIPSFTFREITAPDHQTPPGRPLPGEGVEIIDPNARESETPEQVAPTAPAPKLQAPARLKASWITLISAACIAIAIYLAMRPAPIPRILNYRQLTRDGQGKLDAFSIGTPAPLVTDGSRIYFNEVAGSQVLIKEVSTSGGEVVPLGGGLKEPLVALDISPDRSQLLATSFYQPLPDQQLYTLPLPGGSVRPLGQIAGHDGAWSPDGSHIAYAKGNRLYVASASGADSKQIAEFEGPLSWPRWSPDGHRLRLTVQDASGGTALWEVEANGSSPHRLLEGWDKQSDDCCGSWSPDGKFFVFQVTRNGTTGLWALRERAWRLGDTRSEPAKLTDGPQNVWSPAFSADGRSIFAVVQQRRGELVRYDEASHNFVLYLNGISADHVEFSHDRQWIAYSTYPERTIWRSHPDGSERLQLSFAPMSAIFARWSPDGQRIAFMGSLPGKAVRIYLVPFGGGNPEPLLPNDDALEIDPNWSPSGDAIMFARLPSLAGNGDGRSVIQVYDLKSRRLSTVFGSEGLTAPRWSPDGRYVVATALSQGKWGHPAVLIYDFKTAKWASFEDDPIDNKWWSADGQYFYFDKYMNSDPAIYRIRLSDRAVERVAGLKDVRRSLNMMGWWMGLAADNSPMVLRDTSIEEIYALDWDRR